MFHLSFSIFIFGFMLVITECVSPWQHRTFHRQQRLLWELIFWQSWMCIMFKSDWRQLFHFIWEVNAQTKLKNLLEQKFEWTEKKFQASNLAAPTKKWWEGWNPRWKENLFPLHVQTLEWCGPDDVEARENRDKKCKNLVKCRQKFPWMTQQMFLSCKSSSPVLLCWWSSTTGVLSGQCSQTVSENLTKLFVLHSKLFSCSDACLLQIRCFSWFF